MKTPVSSIRNVGPKMEKRFAEAGLQSAEEVREMGAEAAYRRLLVAGRRPHFIAFYALYLGLQGRPWNDMDPGEKAKLRGVFDNLVASVQPAEKSLGELEANLDFLGVVPRKARH